MQKFIFQFLNSDVDCIQSSCKSNEKSCVLILVVGRSLEIDQRLQHMAFFRVCQVFHSGLLYKCCFVSLVIFNLISPFEVAAGGSIHYPPSLYLQLDLDNMWRLYICRFLFVISQEGQKVISSNLVDIFILVRTTSSIIKWTRTRTQGIFLQEATLCFLVKLSLLSLVRVFIVSFSFHTTLSRDVKTDYFVQCKLVLFVVKERLRYGLKFEKVLCHAADT